MRVTLFDTKFSEEITGWVHTGEVKDGPKVYGFRLYMTCDWEELQKLAETEEQLAAYIMKKLTQRTAS
jgi:hypothetical protein